MQHDPSVQPAVAGAGISAGTRLRQAREARGESVSEVSALLRLAPRQIEALERDDYAALPGPAFALGFLRNYARHLKLDFEPLQAEAQSRLGTQQVNLAPVSNAQGELPQGQPRRLRTLPLAVLTAGLVLALALGWYFDGFRTEPPAPERADSESVVMLSAPLQTPEIIPEPAPETAVPAAAALAPSSALAAGTAAAAVAPPAPLPDVVTPVAAPVAAAAAPVADLPAAAPAPDGWLQFRFAGQAWIEIRDADRRILYSGINRAGSSRVVQGRRPFVLMINNADQVSLEHDGKAVDLTPHTTNGKARLTLK
jgi:cytoskeleton protein RodZ